MCTENQKIAVDNFSKWKGIEVPDYEVTGEFSQEVSKKIDELKVKKSPKKVTNPALNKNGDRKTFEEKTTKAIPELKSTAKAGGGLIGKVTPAAKAVIKDYNPVQQGMVKKGVQAAWLAEGISAPRTKPKRDLFDEECLAWYVAFNSADDLVRANYPEAPR